MATTTMSCDTGRNRNCARAARKPSSTGIGSSITDETIPNRIANIATLVRLRRSSPSPDSTDFLVLRARTGQSRQGRGCVAEMPTKIPAMQS